MEYVKPWSNDDSYVEAIQKFYEARSGWRPTWDVMQVDFVRVYQKA
jgi:hypothetical protein